MNAEALRAYERKALKLFSFVPIATERVTIYFFLKSLAGTWGFVDACNRYASQTSANGAHKVP